MKVKLLNFLKYKGLFWLEFIIKFIIVFVIVPLISFGISAYLDTLISNFLPRYSEKLWVEDLRSFVTMIEILVLPVVLTYFAWVVVFTKSKDIVKPEEYLGSSIEDIKLKAYVNQSLKNVPIGTDFDTFCVIFNGMKGLSSPVYGGKNGDIHTYYWVLDCYMSDKSKKAGFIANFKDNLFIGYDNSNLLG